MPVTSTQSVSIPPDVLARYNAVNAQAQAVAQQPFNPYAQYPSAFVSPLSRSQQAAIYNINRAQGMTEPYYQQAAQMAGASTAGVYNPNVASLSDPYYRAAVQGTQAGMEGAANYGVAAMSAPAYQQAAQAASAAGTPIASGAVARVSDPYYQQAAQQGQYASRDISNAAVAGISDPYYRAATQGTQGAMGQVANYGVAGMSTPAYQQAAQQARYAGRDIASAAVANAAQPYYNTAQALGLGAAQGVANKNIAQMSMPSYMQAQQLTGAGAQGVANQGVAMASQPAYNIAGQMTQGAAQNLANQNIAMASQPAYNLAGQMAQQAAQGLSNRDIAMASQPAYNAATQMTQGAAQGLSNQNIAMASQPAYNLASQLTQQGAQALANQNIAMASQPAYDISGRMVQQAAQGLADRNIAAASQPAYNTASQMTQQAARDIANQGIAGISSPAYAQAQQMTGMAGQVQVPELSAADIQKYMSPYMRQVIDPTMQALRQQQEQAMAGQTGRAIMSGAFGGDRAGIAAANLAGQQRLASGQTLGGLLQQGYGQALSAAQQQQQVRQGEMARVLQAGRQQADIGTMARQAYEQQQAVAQADAARQLQAGLQQANIGTMGRQALEQQQAVAQQDAARQLQAAQQYAGLGTMSREALQAQQAVAQQDAARQLQAGLQQANIGTMGRQALEQQQAVAQADLARQLQAGRQQADIGTMGRQALEQQQAVAQADAARQLQASQQIAGLGTMSREALQAQQSVAQADLARQLQAAQQYAGLGTMSREALQAQQTFAQQDAARQLQAAQQAVSTGTAMRGAYEQQQAIQQADLARQLQVAAQQQGLGTAARQGLEQQQAIAQADAARQLEVSRQQQALGTAGRQAYEQQQALQQADLQRQLAGSQQLAGIGTQARQAAEQQQAIAQADAARQLQVAAQQQGLGTAARQAYEQQQAISQADAARLLDVSRQQQALGTAGRQAYEQQQALQQADLQRQLAGAQQLAGIGTQSRQAAEQQQAIQQADLARMQQAAQLMGGLGTGAQSAALAAAQAQLGAGAAEQQTSQAGLQALYNQFLQQQAYPFQVAQFLGNIAMGTGALSGSTTTTAQAQPFFSDRRLKEGVGAAKYGAEASNEPEVIGETFDGQKIYRYRLLNPRTGELEAPQIGLMADEAERRDPDAVMQDRGTGYKMLDYKRATDDAAEMGRGLGAARMGGAVNEPGDYARGGYVSGGYIDPSDIRNILEAQAQMYAGGGGGIGGAPYAGGGGGIMAKGYVPAVELGSYKLLEPASPPPALTPESSKIASGLEKAAGLSGNLDKLHDLYEKYKESPKSTLLVQPDFSTGSNLYQRGGVARYALGGSLPYGGDSEGYVPEDVLKKPDIETLKAAAPPKAVTPYQEEDFLDKTSGFVDKAGKLASTAGTIYGLGKAGLAALATLSDRRLKTGVGRDGYATFGAVRNPEDGSPEDEDTIRREREIEQTLRFEGGLNPSDTNKTPSMYGINQAAHPGIDVKSLTPAAAKDIYRKEYWEGIGAGNLPENLQGMAYDTAVIAGPGRARKMLAQAGDDPNKFMAAREGFLQNLIARDPEKYGKYEKAWNNRNQTLRLQAGLGNAEDSVANIPLGGRSFYATTVPQDKGLGAAIAPQPTVIPGAEAASEKGKGIVDFITSKEFIIPALTGLGAMASSPSRYLGSAILQGAGAGAQSYMNVLGKEAELAKTAAETEKEKAAAGYTGVQAKKTETELYEKQWVPNVGWIVYNKAKPYEPPQQITDAENKPIGSINPKDIKTAPGQPEVPAQIGKAQAERPPVASALDWKPTLAVPGNIKIPGAMNIALSGDLPKQQEAAKEYMKKLTDQSSAAFDQQFRLEEMERQFRDLPQRGFLQPGSFAGERTKFAKDINTAVMAMGGKPLFDPSDIAAAEELSKDTTRLGFDVSKSLGHEPGFIVQSAVAANPGMENTAIGFQRITAGLREATKYQQDRLTFFEDYLARTGGILTGADKAFRELNPPEAYARRAVLQTIDPEDMQLLRSVPREEIIKNEQEIDQKYGRGVTKLLLGEK